MGTVTNIALDYVFIYPCGMGIEGTVKVTETAELLQGSFGIYYKIDHAVEKKVKN